MSTATVVAISNRSASWTRRCAACVELARPKIAILVLVVVAISGAAAGWGVGNPSAVLHAVVGTLLVAASASALNQVLEHESDAKMPRTADRPLPSGRLPVAVAATLGVASGLLGALYLAAFAGWQPLAWSLLSWAIYVGLYTPLKARSAFNTFVGAVSGALPVWIGWTAVVPTSTPWLELRPLSLFLVVFLWQFPHFMAIAWLYRRQYTAAGLKMMSVVDPTGRSSGLQAVLAAAWLIPVSLLLAWGAPTLGTFCFVAVALSLGLLQLGCSLWFAWTRSERAARYLLRCSLVYLPALLMFLVCIPWM